MSPASVFEPDPRIQSSGVTWSTVGIFFVTEKILSFAFLPATLFIFRPIVLSASSKAFWIPLMGALFSMVAVLIAAQISVRHASGFATKMSVLGLRSAQWYWYVVAVAAVALFVVAFAAVLPTSLSGILETLWLRISSADNDALLFGVTSVAMMLTLQFVACGIVLQVLFRHIANIWAPLLTAFLAVAQIPGLFSTRLSAGLLLLLIVGQFVLALITAKCGSILPAMLAIALMTVIAIFGLW